MIHPMLMPREPAPEIDVSKPALLKNRPFSQRYGYTDANGEPTAKGLATIAPVQADSMTAGKAPLTLYEAIKEDANKFCGIAVDPARPGDDTTATVKYRRDEGGNVVVQHVISVKAGRLWIKDIDLRPGNLIYTFFPSLRDEWASEWDITPDKIWHRVES